MQNLKQELTTKGERNLKFKIEGREDGEAYQSKDNSDSKFGLVCIQEWWGLNQNICNVADSYAKQGFRVITPDIYRGKQAKDYEEAGHLLTGLDWPGAVKDIVGAVKYLKSTGCTKVGVVGFCMGGALTIAVSTVCPEMDAGAPFYGCPDLKIWDLANTKAKLFANFAELDDLKGFSDVETAKNFQKVAESKGAKVTLKIWPNVKHAFCNADYGNYDANTHKEAMKQVVEFFKDTFKQ